ncbi:YitT family protein [Alkaliphilus sp. MSJ-5]|uniref:YitT family protein n=1 Tax=Alkaliphilus flagellatus TaxID=2841507 RepID=A0ABS6G1W8_9FIRM|nr:YitT family protein [Alkaliphilus flagellatus]MBU5675361.1 YitT family protein [Alkaliphilus flagellatus]
MESTKRAFLSSKNISINMNKIGAIILGNLLCSIAINGFFIPNKLLSGGVGGVSIMIYYLTQIPTGFLIFLINIPIFLIGMRIVDKEFAAYSFISMFFLSFLMEITTGIDKYIVLDDIILAAIFGAILNGVGMGILFRSRVSQGGLDIIAAIFKKKYNINVGTGLMLFNTVIVAVASTLFGLKPAMYTLIAMYVAYKIVDKVQEGLDQKKNVMIVSDKAEEMAEVIMDKLNRGVTFLQAEGGYSKSNKKVIYCILTTTQIAKLKEIIEQHDPKAFMTIQSIQEVQGTGFRNIGI